jgi:hypothetical protein
MTIRAGIQLIHGASAASIDPLRAVSSSPRGAAHDPRRDAPSLALGWTPARERRPTACSCVRNHVPFGPLDPRQARAMFAADLRVAAAFLAKEEGRCDEGGASSAASPGERHGCPGQWTP